MLSKEAFDDWKENPATIAVMNALKAASEVAKEMWVDQAWQAPYLTAEQQVDLALLKAKSQISEDLSELDYEGLLAFMSKDKEQTE